MADLRAASRRYGRAPSREEVESWTGFRVDDLNGHMLGHVESIIGDEEGRPVWIVIAEFRLGDGRRFYIPAFDAVAGGGRVWSPHLRSEVRRSARLVGRAPFNEHAQRRLDELYAGAFARQRAA